MCHHVSERFTMIYKRSQRLKHNALFARHDIKSKSYQLISPKSSSVSIRTTLIPQLNKALLSVKHILLPIGRKRAIEHIKNVV